MTGIQVLPPDKSYESQLAQELLSQGTAQGPVYSQMQGLGKLAQVLSGQYLMKKEKENETARQAVMTGNLQAAIDAATDKDTGQLNRQILAKQLMQTPETANMGLQLELQDSSQQAKQKQYHVLTSDEVKQKNLDPRYQYQQDITDGPNGNIETLGAAKPDPAKLSSMFNTKGYDDQGNLVQIRKGVDDQGKVHVVDKSPIPPKPMDDQSSKQQAALITLSDLGEAMRGLVKSPNFNWNGPVSGPIAMKMQQYGLDPKMTNEQAFATLSAHYTPLFTSLLGSRAGVKMLQRMDELRPSAAYPVSRNIMQLDATDAVINSFAKEMAGNFAGTGYNIDPRLIKIAKKSGFDPNNASTASSDFLPSIPQAQGGGGAIQPIPEGATATGPGGHKIVYKSGQWLDAQTGNPIGQ